METFQIELTHRKNAFEKWLKSYFSPSENPFKKLAYEAMTYSLFSGGKRIRPLCLMATAEIFGVEEKAKPFALAIEMIHTYSLIHDDLPAMDDDNLRRGKPTNHMVFGEAQAILAGDALLNEAHTLMIGAILEEKDSVFPAKAAWEISSKAGPKGMILGQLADIVSENKDVNAQTLEFIHRHKTGALLESAFVAGALLGKADENQIDILRTVAQKTGYAFQIVDDILDIEGTEEELGKKIGQDSKHKKATYPSRFGLKASKEKVEILTNEAIDLLNALMGNTEFLKKMVCYLARRGH